MDKKSKLEPERQQVHISLMIHEWLLVAGQYLLLSDPLVVHYLLMGGTLVAH